MDTGNEELEAARQAVKDAARKRRAKALAMRRDRYKLKQIGATFGVTTERARQMILQAEREEADGE